MNSTWWNSLRPNEKRLVVAVGVVLFFVFNGVFIVPHFSDLKMVGLRTEKARQTLAKYQGEIQQMTFYKTNVDKMQGAGGMEVPPEEQAYAFSTAVQMQASRSGVQVTGSSKLMTRTNQFFLELSQTISVQSAEPQLVNFLYNLGSGTSLMRVRSLTLRPDAPRYQLSANITLVASYQKKVATKAGPALRPAGPPPRPGTPATTASR